MSPAGRKSFRSIRGHSPKSKKIPDDQVKVIRARLDNGERGKDLAAEYGVDSSAISDIKTGRRFVR